MGFSTDYIYPNKRVLKSRVKGPTNRVSTQLEPFIISSVSTEKYNNFMHIDKPFIYLNLPTSTFTYTLQRWMLLSIHIFWALNECESVKQNKTRERTDFSSTWILLSMGCSVCLCTRDLYGTFVVSLMTELLFYIFHLFDVKDKVPWGGMKIIFSSIFYHQNEDIMALVCMCVYVSMCLNPIDLPVVIIEQDAFTPTCSLQIKDKRPFCGRNLFQCYRVIQSNSTRLQSPNLQLT